MTHFNREGVERLNKPGVFARSGSGRLPRIHRTETTARDDRRCYCSPIEKRALGAVVTAPCKRGMMVTHTASIALSTPMGQDEISCLCEAVERALSSIRSRFDGATRSAIAPARHGG